MKQTKLCISFFDNLPSRMNIDGIYNFDVFQEHFRTRVIQHQISQQLSGKFASAVTEKTVSCRNCKFSHHVNECRNPCSHTSCTGFHPLPAKECPH